MKNIIITGTSRGIGFELVKLFSGKEYNVLALSRNKQPIEELNLPNVTAFAFDLNTSDYKTIATFIEKEWRSKVDVLINNAGYLVNKPFLELTHDDFLNTFEVNVIGLARMIQFVIPFMTKGGHVVNISSMGGVQGSVKFPGLAAYSSSKGAVITLTELLAEEFKDSGPSFNVLALGAVQTQMLEEAFPGYKAPLSALEMATYICDFALKGHQFYNGKLLQVSSSTP